MSMVQLDEQVARMEKVDLKALEQEAMAQDAWHRRCDLCDNDAPGYVGLGQHMLS